jgi:hypothetical protein
LSGHAAAFWSVPPRFFSPTKECAMDTLTLVIIIIVVLLVLGSGGFWYRGRR